MLILHRYRIWTADANSDDGRCSRRRISYGHDGNGSAASCWIRRRHGSCWRDDASGRWTATGTSAASTHDASAAAAGRPAHGGCRTHDEQCRHAGPVGGSTWPDVAVVRRRHVGTVTVSPHRYVDVSVERTDGRLSFTFFCQRSIFCVGVLLVCVCGW